MKDMTLEELRVKLDELGIPHDQWQAVEGRPLVSPIIQRQVELLTRLRDLLEEGIKEKQAEVAELRAVVQRMKHGGGV